MGRGSRQWENPDGTGGSALLTSDQKPIHPARLMFEIMQRIDENHCILMVVMQPLLKLVPARYRPGPIHGNCQWQFRTSGVGVPYAIAAKLAHPDKKVILLTGDGAFGYGAMECDTAIRYGIKFTTIILNDSCWE